MKKFYMFSYLILSMIFIIVYFFMNQLSETFLSSIINIILITSLILLPNCILRTSYFKFYDDRCKYGLFIRFTTKYQGIKAICITDNWVRLGGKILHPVKIDVKTQEGKKSVIDAFVTIHKNDNFSKYLDVPFHNEQKDCISVYKKHEFKFNSLDLRNMRSYIAGFSLKRGIDLYKIFKNFEGKVYIKRSIYAYHKVYLDIVFKNSNYDYNKIIFIEDEFEYDRSISLESYYSNSFLKNGG